MPPVQNQQAPNDPYPTYAGPGVPQPVAPLPRNHSSKLPLILAIVFGVLLLVTLIFAFWAFSQASDYKNNSDQKSAVAVKAAEKVQAEKLAAEFAEKEKSPYKTYQSTADIGGVKIVYPKTWGAYVDETPQSSTPVNGFFHPSFVPKTTGDIPMALRVQVISQPYTEQAKQYDSKVKSGDLKASPFSAELVPSAKGLRFDGKISSKVTGSVILLPLRDKTLKIWTENPANINDLNTIVLKNLTFSP